MIYNVFASVFSDFMALYKCCYYYIIIIWWDVKLYSTQVNFLATGYHCFLVGTKLHRLVTEAHLCEQLGQSGCRHATSKSSHVFLADLV